MRGRKANSNVMYYGEMNVEPICNWLSKQVFREFKERGRKCINVLYRATYFALLLDDNRPPIMNWRKLQLMQAINR